MPETNTNSPGSTIAMGATILACALYFLYIGLSHPPGLNTSSWVIYVLAATWTACGVRLLQTATGNAGRGAWVGFIFCAGMGTVFMSIPFDGHPEACHTSTSVGFLTSSLLGGNFCVSVFGFVGLLMIVAAVLIAWRAISSRFRKKPSY